MGQIREMIDNVLANTDSAILATHKNATSVVIHFDDGHTLELRQLENGTIWDENNHCVVDTTYTLGQIIECAIASGCDVDTYTPEETDELDKTRKKAREDRWNSGVDYELGYGVPWGNREYRKTARLSRLASRVQRRRP